MKNTGKTEPRTIDTIAYLTVLRELVEEGKSVSLLISGNSMFPFLEDGRDSIYFEAPKRRLRKGDVAFYQRKNGQFVVHRICRAGDDGFYLVGDAQTVVEGPIERGQIFAIVTCVLRNGKKLDETSLIWRFFEKAWIRVIPARKFLMLPWRAVRKMRKGN